MKTIKLNLLVLAMALFAISCNDQSTNTNHQNHGTQAMNESASKDISLNNGEKWPVNEEMKPYILESETILNEYIEIKSSDYKALASQLREKNTGLIKSCTMKGESHDELHKWLHPHMELIESLDNADTKDKGQTTVNQLKQSFETYHQYFQ